MSKVSSLEVDERRQFAEIGFSDLQEMNRGDADTLDVLELIFGLKLADEKYRDLAVAFRCFGRNFGSAIGGEPIVGGVFGLELETRLIHGIPPLSFPVDDENVSYLDREEVIVERRRFSASIDSAVTSEIASKRAVFLNWLDSRENAKADLVVVQP